MAGHNAPRPTFHQFANERSLPKRAVFTGCGLSNSTTQCKDSHTSCSTRNKPRMNIGTCSQIGTVQFLCNALTSVTAT